MTTAAIRRKLHNYLEVADDKKIKAIYTMVEEEIKMGDVEYAPELNRRLAAYENGTEKIVTAAESKKRISKLLKGAKK